MNAGEAKEDEEEEEEDKNPAHINTCQIAKGPFSHCALRLLWARP